MKRPISLILICAMMLSLLSGCGAKPVQEKAVAGVSTNEETIAEAHEEVDEKDLAITTGGSPEPFNESVVEMNNDIRAELPEDTIPDFNALNDPELLQYVEDSIYTDLAADFQNENYIIEDVNAVYVSKEYLEELAYNSQANIFFGYTLEELDQQFQGTRYVFTLGRDGTTLVQPFEAYDDTFEQIIKNVAIGTGVIFVCITVSVITGGAGLSTVSMVFAASAKGATSFALSTSLFSGVFNGVLEGIQSQDFDKALKAAALSGSEGFKWGAFTGATIGGFSEFSRIRSTARALEGAIEYASGTVEISDDLAAWQQAELRALNEYGGYEQLSYLDGKLVDFGTPNATRPDIVRNLGDHIEAVEVKYYNLESERSLRTLYSELQREISARVSNLPAGSTQRIVLDVTGRGFSIETVDAVKSSIWAVLDRIYPNIPIDVIGLL